MSTKKKPKAAALAPPLIKLKFEKFPNKLVGVFFEPAKRCFYANFGFDQYEAPSVNALEQKLKAAIKNGATPEPVWVPMIDLGISVGRGRYSYNDARDVELHVDVERQQYCIGAGGKLRERGWNPKKDAGRECYGGLGKIRPKRLNAPIFSKDPRSWDGGSSLDALLPYTEQLWKQITGVVDMMRDHFAAWISTIANGTPGGGVNAFTGVKMEMVKLAKPSTPPSKSKPAAKKAKPTAIRPLINFAGEGIRVSVGPLPLKLQNAMSDLYPGMNNCHLLKDGRIQIIQGLLGKTIYLSVDALQKALDTVHKNPRLFKTEGQEDPELAGVGA